MLKLKKSSNLLANGMALLALGLIAFSPMVGNASIFDTPATGTCTVNAATGCGRGSCTGICVFNRTLVWCDCTGVAIKQVKENYWESF